MSRKAKASQGKPRQAKASQGKLRQAKASRPWAVAKWAVGKWQVAKIGKTGCRYCSDEKTIIYLVLKRKV